MLRMTLQTQLVLRELLAEPGRERYGLEMCDLAGLPSGTVYPILARLEQAGWLESAWEDPALHEAAGRPRRRFYRVTPDGAEQARAALATVARTGRRSRIGSAAARLGEATAARLGGVAQWGVADRWGHPGRVAAGLASGVAFEVTGARP